MGRIKKDKNPDVELLKVNYGVSNKFFSGESIIDNIGDDINTIRKVFEIFNDQLFDGQLETPLIYIVPNLKVKYNIDMPDGWAKIKKDKEEKDCIKMYLSEELYKEPLKDIYVCLVDAMIMQYDLEMYMIHKNAGTKWIRLINNNNNYYGKKYIAECKNRGLKVNETIIGKGKKPDVSAGERFDEIYVNYNIEKYFAFVHQYKPNNLPEKGNRNSMRLFICPSCGLKIRITKKGDVDIRCYNGKCDGVRFEPEKKETNQEDGKAEKIVSAKEEEIIEQEVVVDEE